MGQTFLEFLESPFYGFPTVNDTTIINEHPCLLICGPGTDFWVTQEVGREGQNPLVLFEISFPWAFQLYMK